jgi:hypothetical protein
MFFGDPYAKPEIVGTVDETLLDGLDEQFADCYLEKMWYSSTHDSEEGLPEALASLNDLILSREVQLGRQVPYAIDYSAETGPISPEQSQRGQGWHVDGSGRRYGFVVANTLPTEFLIRERERRLNVARFLPHSREVRLTLSDEELERKGLTVYSPDPYQVAAFSGSVHRSPVNKDSVAMRRNWIRAVIIRSQKEDILAG